MLEKWAMIVLIGISLFGIGFAKGCQHATKDHDLFVAKMTADSEKLLGQVLQRNAALKSKYDSEAREKDKSYANTIAAIRARSNAAAGVRLFDPASQGCGSPAATGKDGSGSVESASTGRELSGKLTQFLVTEATRADEVKAYADTCYAWINFK